MKKLTNDEFIKKSKIVHGEKYDYSKVNYVNDKIKISIICKMHGIFEQRPSCHMKGQNCPKCNFNKLHSLNTKSTSDFINDAIKIHNNLYDYSKSFYKNNKTKINIVCKIHGEFLQLPNNHLNGSRCPKCQGNFIYDKLEFIKKANVIHKNKYNYEFADYRNVKSKIKILCKTHGFFNQFANNHLRGSGCKKCSIINSSKIKSKNQDFIINSFIKTHGNRYDYNNVVYKNIKTKVNILCKKHGMFKQHPYTHIKGSGCPKCKISKGEIKIKNFLDLNKIYHIYQKSFENCRNPKTNCCLKFDFYIPDKNILIEYDGEQHFKCSKVGKHTTTSEELEALQFRDNLKTKYAFENNFKLIRISYLDYNRLEEILTQTLF